jgi:predicted ester cyclase
MNASSSHGAKVKTRFSDSEIGWGNRVACGTSRLLTGRMEARLVLLRANPQSANGDDLMSQDNKEVVSRWFREFWGNPWNPKVIDELATSDILVHYPMHEPKKGREAVANFMTEFRDAFPDLNFHGVGDLIAEGDYVVGRWEGGGTHTGPAFSDFRMGSIPAASGRKMQFAGTTVLRLERGRIAEELGQEDALSAMLQIGLIRTPEPDGPAARPGGSLPPGWNNMSGYPEGVR